MKLNIGKRVLMFFHWLFSLLIVAAFAVYLIVPDFLLDHYYNRVVDAIGHQNVKIIGIALLAIYVILAVAQACLIFKRVKKAERGFITVDSSDNGKVRIAISAIEQMVRQSVGSIDGITEMKIGIENQDDAIGIVVNAAIVNGSHVPTITMNMQRAIRQFVETNCGVAVRMVSISINSVTAQAEAGRKHRRGKAQDTLSPVSASGGYDYTPVTTPQPEPQPEPEPEPTPAFVPEPVSMPTFEAPQPQAEAPAEAPEPDLDAPYESQFARDLAEMKARDAEAEQYGEADEPDADGE